MTPPQTGWNCRKGALEPPPIITDDLEAPYLEWVKPKLIKSAPDGYLYRESRVMREAHPPSWIPPPDSSAVAGYGPIAGAPPAARPAWLPTSGKGIASVDPLCWSMRIEQWVFFLRACVDTETWKETLDNQHLAT